MRAFVALSFVFCTKPSDCLGERFRNDLFCVEWDVKPQLTHDCCRYDDGRGAAVDEDEGRDRYEDDGGRRRPRGRRSESDGGNSDVHPLVVMTVVSIDWLFTYGSLSEQPRLCRGNSGICMYVVVPVCRMLRRFDIIGLVNRDASGLSKCVPLIPKDSFLEPE